MRLLGLLILILAEAVFAGITYRFRDSISALGLTDALSADVAFGTMLLAVATVYLGIETRELAKQSSDASRREDERHMDQFKPVCVAFPTDRDRFPAEFGGRNDVILFKSMIKNMGPGPALNGKVSIRLPEGVTNPPSHRFMPIAAGSSSDPAFEVGFTLPARASGEHFTLTIEYEDIFGNTFWSSYEAWDPIVKFRKLPQGETEQARPSDAAAED